jgi:hypothetical protein
VGVPGLEDGYASERNSDMRVWIGIISTWTLLAADSWMTADNPNPTQTLEYTKDKYNAKIIK